jgi:acyl-CoA thioesterase-1
MPLGDSITQGTASGEDDPNFQESYRLDLWNQLVNAGYDVNFVGSLNAGSSIPDFDPDHEGHGGWSDDDILNGKPGEGKLADWLDAFQPDIVLLHIGTNDLDPSPDDVEAILDEIDAFSPDVWVVLALIINRACCEDTPPCPECQETMDFNDNIEDMALDRVNNPGNPAYPDNIIIVDMEAGANINYTVQPAGDMWDNLHPYQFGLGYDKLADVWFDALKQILPDTPNNSNGNSGGGSSCFITSLAYGLPMEPHGKVLRELRDEFMIGRWNRLSLGGISLLALPKGSAATLALMVTMVVLISIWVAIVLRRRQGCHPLRSRLWHIICRMNLIKPAALRSSNSK